MSSPSFSRAVPEPKREPEAQEAPFSPALIEDLLKLTGKAARAHQLYLPNNPVYRTAIDTLRASFAPIWAETDEITLTVLESELRWYGAAVLGGESGSGAGKSPDNLAWLFYKDGVRELKLMRGFEETEVVTFLEIIQRARKGSADEDDLVTMLWEADFTCFTYKYIDLLQDGGGGADDVADGTEVAPAATDDVRRATQEAVEESRAGKIVNMAEFDSTLYFLEEREIEYLQHEIAREYEQDLRSNLVAILLDIFETQQDAAIRSEVIGNLQTLMIHMLTAGHFRGVASVLREGQLALRRATGITPEHQKQLVQLSERLSAPDALSQLLQSLDESPTLPPNDEVAELFDQLQPAALATVFQWLHKIQHEGLRALVEHAAGRLAAANTTELVRLVSAGDEQVSAEAIRRAGALKAQAAVLALSKILSEPDVLRRRLAVQALTEIGSPGALQVLERSIEDADRDVRLTAVRALGLRTYRPALPRLESAIKSKALRDADLTEKMAFFECYGAVCGDAGVASLDATLNGKGFLGRREDPEIRACAAIALGRIGTEKSLDALRRAAAGGDKEVVVRNAVSRALRGVGAGAS